MCDTHLSRGDSQHCRLLKTEINERQYFLYDAIKAALLLINLQPERIAMHVKQQVVEVWKNEVRECRSTSA